MKKIFTITLCFFLFITLNNSRAFASSGNFPKLFGFNEIDQFEMKHLPQWGKVMTRHPKEDFDKNNEKLDKWLSYVETLNDLSPVEKIKKVNWYVNTKKYIIDMNNYGQADYWAIVKEFLHNNGDCEDYSITKFYSLVLLGFKQDDMRILILQDTNLGIAHAVLAVTINGDVLILDNQSTEVISHKKIVHYTPLYSVNEKQWWLHLPPM